MKYLLDTCVISDFFKKISNVVTHFENVLPTQIYISTVTVMEIEYGLKLNEEREKKIRPVWENLLQQIKILDFSSQCAHAVALIRSKLKSMGLPIGPYNVLIAGTCLAHHLIMVTSNGREFTRVEELKIEDWREQL
jgi:tRNA(fMet)-specific endonuclease VapC